MRGARFSSLYLAGAVGLFLTSCCEKDQTICLSATPFPVSFTLPLLLSLPFLFHFLVLYNCPFSFPLSCLLSLNTLALTLFLCALKTVRLVRSLFPFAVVKYRKLKACQWWFCRVVLLPLHSALRYLADLKNGWSLILVELLKLLEHLTFLHLTCKVWLPSFYRFYIRQAFITVCLCLIEKSQ